jgi:hypothetical protein
VKLNRYLLSKKRYGKDARKQSRNGKEKINNEIRKERKETS